MFIIQIYTVNTDVDFLKPEIWKNIAQKDLYKGAFRQSLL